MQKSDYIGLFHKIYKDIPKASAQKADELITRAADIAIVLNECQEHIEEEGSVVEMLQGNYSIMRENPYSKVADAKIKSYLSIIDKLDKMLPAKVEAEKDELLEFIK